MLFHLFKKILDIIFPEYCLGCKKNGSILCRECEKNLQKIGSFCAFCGMSERIHTGVCKNCMEIYRVPSLEIYWTVHYRDKVVRRLIKNFKYRSVRSAGKLLGRILLENSKDVLTNLKNKPAVIIPVSMHPQKIKRRGFNHAEFLAKFISDKTGIEITADVLQKIKNTDSQAMTRSRQSRLSNMKGSFAVLNSEKIKNKTVVLVDDVLTTGATIIETTRVLKKSGAGRVVAIVVAH